MVRPATPLGGALIGIIAGSLIGIALSIYRLWAYTEAIKGSEYRLEIFFRSIPTALQSDVPFWVAVGGLVGLVVGSIGAIRRTRAGTAHMQTARPTPSVSPSVARTRWCQYSLRTLLLVMLVTSIAMSYIAVGLQRAAKVRQAKETLANLQGTSIAGILDLRNTAVTDEDLSRLVYLPRIELVYLSHTSISDAGLAHMRGLRDVKFLSLAHTRITDEGLRHAGELRNLESLRLSGTAITGTGLRYLGNLQRLTELVLRRTSIDDEALGRLPPLAELRDLDLCETNVSDAGLEHLARHPKLQSIGLGKTRATPTGFTFLKARMPRIEWFQNPDYDE